MTNFTKPEVLDPYSTENQFLISALKTALNGAESGSGDLFEKGLYKTVDGVKDAPRTILSVMLNYAFNDNASMGFGPYLTLVKWDKPPVVALKINFTLGGGKF